MTNDANHNRPILTGNPEVDAFLRACWAQQAQHNDEQRNLTVDHTPTPVPMWFWWGVVAIVIGMPLITFLVF